MAHTLKNDATPNDTKKLNYVLEEHPALTLHRARVDKWRIVYVFDSENAAVEILTVCKRPPYNYENLAELMVGYLERN